MDEWRPTALVLASKSIEHVDVNLGPVEGAVLCRQTDRYTHAAPVSHPSHNSCQSLHSSLCVRSPQGRQDASVVGHTHTGPRALASGSPTDPIRQRDTAAPADCRRCRIGSVGQLVGEGRAQRQPVSRQPVSPRLHTSCFYCCCRLTACRGVKIRNPKPMKTLNPTQKQGNEQRWSRDARPRAPAP